MAAENVGSRDELVLVLAPTGRDAPLTCALLTERTGVRCKACADIAEVCDQIQQSAGAAVITEEALNASGARRLLDVLSAQLPWSDLPVLILTNDPDPGGGAIATLRQRGNVTVLDRPVRIVTLVSAVQSALRARRRQYEVRDLLDQTRKAIEQRDQFLAMLGHELRNPLATITHALTVLGITSRPINELEGEQREIIRRQTDHLRRLVDDLLDVSRITSGKVALQRKASDLCEVVKGAVKAVQATAQAQHHEIDLHCSAHPVFVDADPVRLEQVVNNLLTNAIKYTPPGGRITVSTAASGEEALLRVRDNGIGMTAELLPRVFDLFTQGQSSLDRAQGGLGIGLTLVRMLVEMHGGQVTAHSDGPNRGSEFIVKLPRMPAPQALTSDAATPDEGVRNGQHLRVLVIEDQPDARRSLQRLLQLWGHRVHAAPDGPTGVSLAAEVLPQVALVDIGLPGFDGYEVARYIRAQFGDAIHLIALTGYGQPEDQARARQAGFDLHLVKPVTAEQLAQTLDRVSHRGES